MRLAFQRSDFLPSCSSEKRVTSFEHQPSILPEIQVNMLKFNCVLLCSIGLKEKRQRGGTGILGNRATKCDAVKFATPRRRGKLRGAATSSLLPILCLLSSLLRVLSPARAYLCIPHPLARGIKHCLSLHPLPLLVLLVCGFRSLRGGSFKRKSQGSNDVQSRGDGNPALHVHCWTMTHKFPDWSYTESFPWALRYDLRSFPRRMSCGRLGLLLAGWPLERRARKTMPEPSVARGGHDVLSAEKEKRMMRWPAR